MNTGYSRSPKLIHGAIMELTDKLVVPLPNIIIFQYNPDTVSRTMEPFQEPENLNQAKKNPATAQPYDPKESFSLNLEFDASDALETPELHPVAVLSGVADRIAALEMLLYPRGDAGKALLAGASAALAGATSSGSQAKRKQVPIILFFWGLGRVVPVRLTSFSVEEQLYSTLLYPLHAKVTVGMKVLAPGELPKEKSLARELAEKAYQYTLKQKQLLAAANIANNAEAALRLPFM